MRYEDGHVAVRTGAGIGIGIGVGVELNEAVATADPYFGGRFDLRIGDDLSPRKIQCESWESSR